MQQIRGLFLSALCGLRSGAPLLVTDRPRSPPRQLWPWGFRFSRRFPREEQAMFDVWMTIVMAHAVTRDYQPPAAA